MKWSKQLAIVRDNAIATPACSKLFLFCFLGISLLILFAMVQAMVNPSGPLGSEQIIIAKEQKVEQNKQTKEANLYTVPSTLMPNRATSSTGQGLTLQQAQKYTDIWKVRSLKELPFCILGLSSSPQLRQRMLDSLHSQPYTNYFLHILEPSPNSTNRYENYRQIIKEGCPQNTLLLFLKGPIGPTWLPRLNSVHQQYRAWLTYAQAQGQGQEGVIRIGAFYSRVFQLLDTNDFGGQNIELLKGQAWEDVLAMGVIELCEYQTRKMPFKSPQIQSMLLQLNMSQWSTEQPYNRTPYTRLYKLSQDFAIDPTIQDKRIQSLKAIRADPQKRLYPQKLHKAFQREQIPYLPVNHSLNDLELLELSAIYDIHRYQTKEKKVPMCLTVLSHNNVQNGRYRKCMLSVMQQQYQNFHVVFIDDNSDDGNMEATMQLVSQAIDQNKFQKERVAFVQNRQRMYATYNIINAAYNFCQQGDIQVLLDGDDELIGRHALAVINAVYQRAMGKADRWVVYSNFKSNLNTYGSSQILGGMDRLLLNSGQRRSGHLIGPIRSWRVQLLYHIPLSYHKNSSGSWLDTVYDDALQHSLAQLSGMGRIEYVPQILYEYNKQYGDNDDSTPGKKTHRKETYQWVLGMKPLQKLPQLKGKKDQETAKELEAGRDKLYFLRQL